VSPLASYRRLLDLAGPVYVVVAFLGRLPLAMSQLGTLLLVSGATGSYAAGGLAAGMLAVANAAGSPVAGILADRLGQRPVVLVQSVAGGLGLVLLVVLAERPAPTGVLVGVAALAGAFLPQVGPLARVRWRPITRDAGAHQTRLVETAFSYEGAADEASFVLGPALLGLLVALADPGTAVSVAAVAMLVFGCAFALHPTAGLTHRHRPRSEHGGRVLTAVFTALLGAQLVIGVIFGSVQTGITVLATSEGNPGAAGLIHGVLGIGSAVAALAVAGLPRSITFSTRMLVFATGLLVLATPLLVTDSLGVAALVVLLLGLVVGPYMIGNFTMAERAAPPARLAAALTLIAGATGVGYALGSAVAGRLADHSGHTAAFAVTVAAGGAAALLALLAQPLVRRLDGAPAAV
jgi:MFS family permease